MHKRILFSFFFLFPLRSSALDLEHTVYAFREICDASGVVSLDERHFVVADDERNVLVTYAFGATQEPVSTLELSEFLDVRTTEGEIDEVDIEDGAALGDTIFWISSHGRKQSGKKAKSRQRLFATRVLRMRGSQPVLKPMGIPYRKLLKDLSKDARYKTFELKEAAKKAPKDEGGLNIEGLGFTQEGALLIGFRNPLIDGKALIAVLLNPTEVIVGKDAEFGSPLLLDLDQRGIRGMASDGRRLFLIGNDPLGQVNRGAFFLWDGKETTTVSIAEEKYADFNPEAAAFLDSKNILLLSDDGALLTGGLRCKDQEQNSDKQFRAAIFPLPEG